MFEACFGCLQVYSARPQQRDMQYSSFKVDTAELKLQDLDLEVQRKTHLACSVTLSGFVDSALCPSNAAFPASPLLSFLLFESCA